MKKMRCTSEVYLPHQREKLDEGTYDGRKYVIVSYGDHPCAYVKVPKNTKYDHILVHGGITFYGKLRQVYGDRAGYYIGWDYAHDGDFLGCMLAMQDAHMMPWFTELKRWTTEEILEDVKSVIAQLNS